MQTPWKCFVANGESWFYEQHGCATGSGGCIMGVSLSLPSSQITICRGVIIHLTWMNGWPCTELERARTLKVWTCMVNGMTQGCWTDVRGLEIAPGTRTQNGTAISRSTHVRSKLHANSVTPMDSCMQFHCATRLIKSYSQSVR